LIELPVALLALAPLSIVAGVDLYLTLLLIGVAPTTSLWETPLPGALGDLDSPGLLIVVGSCYLLEFAAERFGVSSLVWNGFHALLRPLSGFLLGVLVLDGFPLWAMTLGALCAGFVASFVHAVRSGGAIIRRLTSNDRPSPLLLSLTEDVGVLAVVVLTLDRPGAAAALAGGLLIATLPFAANRLRAFGFGITLVASRPLAGLRARRWHGSDALPSWVTEALAEDSAVQELGPVRGTPAAGHRLPGAPAFAIGWLVIREGSPAFAYRARSRSILARLEGAEASALEQHPLHRTLSLHSAAGRFHLLFRQLGPTSETLLLEFGEAPWAQAPTA
jgi:hypothetical protein